MARTPSRFRLEGRLAVPLSAILVVRNGLLLRRGGGITPRPLLHIETIGFGVAALTGLSGRLVLHRRAFRAASLIHLVRLAVYSATRCATDHPPARASVTNKG